MLPPFKPEEPKILKYSQHVADNYHYIGSAYIAVKKNVEAIDAYHKALKISQRLVKDNPFVTKYQVDLAARYHNIGTVELSLGKRKDVLEKLRQAERITERLAADNPKVVAYQIRAALGLAIMSLFLRQTGDLNGALQKVEAALRHCRRIAEVAPKNPLLNRNLRKICFLRADMFSQLALGNEGNGEHASALLANERAVTALEEVEKEIESAKKWEVANSGRSELTFAIRTESDFQRALAKCYRRVAFVFGKNGQTLNELVAMGHSTTILERLATTENKSDEIRKELAKNHHISCQALRKVGRVHDALLHAGRSISILKELQERTPDSASAKQALEKASLTRAKTLVAIGRHRESIADWRRALELDSGRFRIFIQADLCMALARCGQHSEATEVANTLPKRGTSTRFAFNVACCYAIAAQAALADTKLSLVERMTLGELHAFRAISILKAVARSRYFRNAKNQNLLRTDPDLNALRHRDDFREIAKSVGVELPAWARRPQSAFSFKQPSTAKKRRTRIGP